jgi:hypothetical protein
MLNSAAKPNPSLETLKGSFKLSGGPTEQRWAVLPLLSSPGQSFGRLFFLSNQTRTQACDGDAHNSINTSFPTKLVRTVNSSRPAHSDIPAWWRWQIDLPNLRRNLTYCGSFPEMRVMHKNGPFNAKIS